MKVQISELKNALKVVKAGLSSGKETTDQSCSFVFQAGMAYTYNDEISVRAPFLQDEDACGAVNSKELPIDEAMSETQDITKMSLASA